MTGALRAERLVAVMPHSERLARNEAYYRQINEQIEQLKPSRGAVDLQIVRVRRRRLREASHDPQQRLRKRRSSPQRFIVYPEHVVPELEVFVSKRRGYRIVQKHGEAAAAAEQLDPRS